MSRRGLFRKFLRGRGQREQAQAEVVVPSVVLQPVPEPVPLARGRAEQEAIEWYPGLVVDGLYEVGEPLGAGGMGLVHRVRHLGWNQDLAVKSPRPQLWMSPQGVEAFLDEAKVWVDLPPHPHICTCHYVRVLHGVPRIFAEYAERGSVSGALAAGQFGTVAEILDVAIQMAWGLHAAHEAGVVHQDVKPANVVLTADGVAKVTDFGLARAQARAEAGVGWQHDDDSGVSILVTWRGMTPEYASPEQMVGKDVGRRSDIWSWGVTLLELFIGKRTWRAGSAAAEALKVYLAQGPPPGRAAMPDGVASLLSDCLAVDPAERPSGMGVVAERLVAVYEPEMGAPYPRRATEAVAQLADGLNNKALSLLDLGEIEGAEECWEQALQADPRHPDSTYNLGLVRWRAARITDDELVDQMEAVHNAGVADGRAEYLLGLVHLERGDVTAAAAMLWEAARLAPTDVEIATASETANKQQVQTRQPLALASHTSSMAVTPDARHALTGSEDGTVRWWDLASGRCLHTLTGHTDFVTSVAVTPDARYAVSGSWDDTVRWWDLASGCCLRTLTHVSSGLTRRTDGIQSVAVTPDARHALTGSADRTVCWWDLGSGRCLHTLTGHTDRVFSVVVSPDGRHALSGSVDGTVRWWDLVSGRCVRTLTGHTNGVSSVVVSPDGRHALSGSADSTVRWWDLASGRCLRTLTGHTDPVWSVVAPPDGRHALSGSEDGTVRWWDLASGRCLLTLTGHTDSLTTVAVTPDARYALSGSVDGTVQWWDLTIGSDAPWSYSRPRATVEVGSLAEQFRTRLDQAQLLLDCGDCAGAADALCTARAIPGFERHPELLDLWRRAGRGGQRTEFLDARHTLTLTGHTSVVTSVAVTPDTCHALSGSADHTVRWWDLVDGRCLQTLTGHTDVVWSVAVTPDARRALTGSFDHTMRWWDLADGRCLGTLTGHTNVVFSVAITPDGRRALSGSGDGTVRWWDLASGRCLRILQGHASNALSVAVTPDGGHALSGSDDGTVRWWDLASGRCLHTLTSDTDPVMSVAVTPDGRHALSGSEGGTVRWWDLGSGRCLRTLTGHVSAVTSLAVTPDTRHALSGSMDCNARWWDLANGRCLHTLTGHTSWIYAVAVTPDACYALSGSEDRTVWLWALDWDYEFPATDLGRA